MSLTKADDYPIHQISKPVSEVGSERNFYDRYFLMVIQKQMISILVLYSAFTQI